MHRRTFVRAADGRDSAAPGTMGNTAMCKVCGSDRGLRTVASLSALGQSDLPDFYCEEHFPAWSPLVLVRGHAGRRRLLSALMFSKIFFYKLADGRRGFCLLAAVSFCVSPGSYFCFGHNLDGCCTL